MFDNNMMPYENFIIVHVLRECKFITRIATPSLWMFMPLCFYSHPIPKYDLKDYGPDPFVINIRQAAKQNENFR